MQTATKVVLGALGALGLYMILSPSEAAAAPAPGQPPPEPPNQPPPNVALPLPPPTGLPTPISDYAGLYVGSQPVSDGPQLTYQMHQIGVIARRAATNDGMLVYLVNKLYKPAPGEVIFVATTDETGQLIHWLSFNAGLVPQPNMGAGYTVVGYTLHTMLPTGTAIYPTLGAAQASADSGITIFPGQANGSGDGAVQRAEALADMTNDKTGTLAYAAVYDVDGSLAVDPNTGNDFLVTRI